MTPYNNVFHLVSINYCFKTAIMTISLNDIAFRKQTFSVGDKHNCQVCKSTEIIIKAFMMRHGL